MSFHAITTRIYRLLEANKHRLPYRGQLHIFQQFPEDKFPDLSIFVWRESIGSVEHHAVTGIGEDAQGQLAGTGTWIVALYVRYPGHERVAARMLDEMVWGLLTVLAGYARDPERVYNAMLIEGTSSEVLGDEAGGGVWVLGERIRLRVSWELLMTGGQS